MLNITLFTKTECGLCEEVKADLADLASAYPHQLIEIDINQDSELFTRYRFRIPVLHIAGQVLQAPISPDALETALASASSRED